MLTNEIYKSWGGMAAKEYYEKETRKKAITTENNIGGRYIPEQRKIDIN